jgi:hypothetical protein
MNKFTVYRPKSNVNKHVITLTDNLLQNGYKFSVFELQFGDQRMH